MKLGRYVWCLVAVLAVAQVAAWAADGSPAAPAAATPAKMAAPAAATPAKMAAPAAMAAEKPTFRYGADLRLREEALDKFQAGPKGENDYFRIRPRIWGEADLMDNVTVRARVANEFRYWLDPEHTSKSSSHFPDEWVLDHLYLDVRNLLDNKLDVRVGRQDLIYGTGKVILEGTPGDGSRTIYFNAVKAVWKGIENTTVDVFGILNEWKDPMAFNTQNRSLTAYPLGKSEVTESGGGVYVKNRSNEKMPVEAYAIYKSESDYALPATPVATNNGVVQYKQPSLGSQQLKGNMVVNPDADIYTLGVRVMPQLAEGVNGNLEAALQFGKRGDEDISASMVDASVSHQLSILEQAKPALDYGVYYLSGDDPKSAKDEGWDPLWARYPQFSELYVFWYWYPKESLGRWSNVLMPHAGLTLSPAAWLKTSAMVAYMTAPEKDGPGGGSERGWLEVVKGEFTIGQKLLTDKDKLTGHLWLECLQPGDYYAGDDTAYFARWQLMYEF